MDNGHGVRVAEQGGWRWPLHLVCITLCYRNAIKSIIPLISRLFA